MATIEPGARGGDVGRACGDHEGPRPVALDLKEGLTVRQLNGAPVAGEFHALWAVESRPMLHARNQTLATGPEPPAARTSA